MRLLSRPVLRCVSKCFFSLIAIATVGGGMPVESARLHAMAPATQAPATQAPATQAPATQAPATPASGIFQVSPMKAPLADKIFFHEVRLRKLHLVRPDLIPYPIFYEIYC